MGKIVILAEKPSVGKSIANVIGCKTVGDGCLKNDRFIVTWAVGHLVTLKEPDEIDEKYKKWDMDMLPLPITDIPLKIIPSSKEQYKIVEKLINAEDTDSLICATDAGREGELIFRYIYIMAKCKKPFKRLWISSMTDEAIRKGMSELRPGREYDALYRSAKCRSEADWIVGMNASRAYSLRYEARISVGRVQTPTLAFLVKRKKEIDSFKAKPFFLLTADFAKYQGTMFSDKLEPDTHIAERVQAEKVAEIIQGKPGTITEATTQRKKDAPPLLYDLTTLQRDANKYFGFTAERTLKLAQSLYETHKALTYPRTDSRYLTPDIIPTLIETMKKMPEQYDGFKTKPVSFLQAAVDEDTVKKLRNVNETKVSDHHAILATNKEPDMEKMSADEKKLFDLVVRRMYSSFYPPHEYDSTKVITKVDRFTFRTIGKTVINNGWRDVKPTNQHTEEAEEKEEDKELPPLRQGETYTVIKTIIKEDETKPPQLYTDASILLAMETAGKDSDDEEIIQQMKGHGIGTPATRAEIIERIIKVGYAVRNKKHIVPTEKGIALIEIMPQEITSAETTGRWELALDKIAESRQEPDVFLQSINRFTSFLVNHAKTNTLQINEAAFASDRKKYEPPKSQMLEGMTCPVCKKGTIREVPAEGDKKGSFFCSEWKDSKCGFRLWKDAFTKAGGPMLTKEILMEILEKGNHTFDKGFLVTNDAENGINCYIEQTGEESSKLAATAPFVYSKADKEDEGPLAKTKCPICHKGHVRESEKAFGCTAWRDGCKMTLWKNCFSRVDGPMMTAEIVAQLFKKKKIAISGATIKLEKGRLLYYKPGTDPEGRDDAITYLTPKKV